MLLCKFDIIALFHEILPLLFFFFNDTATTEIYTLSLHDALPISWNGEEYHFYLGGSRPDIKRSERVYIVYNGAIRGDRKSTRLNSSHTVISYAVFCLKKKKPLRTP